MGGHLLASRALLVVGVQWSYSGVGSVLRIGFGFPLRGFLLAAGIQSRYNFGGAARRVPSNVELRKTLATRCTAAFAICVSAGAACQAFRLSSGRSRQPEQLLQALAERTKDGDARAGR